MKITYKGYTVRQDPDNYHVAIYDEKGKMVCHARHDKVKTVEELKEAVDAFLVLRGMLFGKENVGERNQASATEKGGYPNLMCFGAEPYNCGLENACPDYETCKAEHYRRWYSFMEAQKATGE